MSTAPALAARPPAASTSGRPFTLRPAPAARRSGAPPPRAQTVRLADVDGAVTELRVEEGESILEVALAQGLDVPHDCKMGVCMNCAARLVSGSVDQSAGMLSDDVKAKGYVLLCIALPQGGDVSVRVVEEEELLAEVMDG